MNLGIPFEIITNKDFPSGHFHAHVPGLGLTAHV